VNGVIALEIIFLPQRAQRGGCGELGGIGSGLCVVDLFGF